MEKIKELTQEQFENFKKVRGQKKFIRELLNLPANAKIEIGDTFIKADNTKSLDVLKDTWKGRDFYYIVVKPADEQTAFVYSIYSSM